MKIELITNKRASKGRGVGGHGTNAPVYIKRVYGGLFVRLECARVLTKQINKRIKYNKSGENDTAGDNGNDIKL